MTTSTPLNSKAQYPVMQWMCCTMLCSSKLSIRRIVFAKRRFWPPSWAATKSSIGNPLAGAATATRERCNGVRRVEGAESVLAHLEASKGASYCGPCENAVQPDAPWQEGRACLDLRAAEVCGEAVLTPTRAMAHDDPMQQRKPASCKRDCAVLDACRNSAGQEILGLCLLIMWHRV